MYIDEGTRKIFFLNFSLASATSLATVPNIHVPDQKNNLKENISEIFIRLVEN